MKVKFEDDPRLWRISVSIAFIFNFWYLITHTVKTNAYAYFLDNGEKKMETRTSR